MDNPCDNLPIIGIDFDNTIIGYDHLIRSEAVKRSLIDETVPTWKKAMRDAIRLQPGGEIAWQKIQAAIYGPKIHQAVLMRGVKHFLCTCIQRGITIYIISHKTRFAHQAPDGPDLRNAAMTWLAKQGLFDPDICGLQRRWIFFESTRLDKIERIRALGCTHFIDDLEETFAEPGFPSQVAKLLLSPCEPERHCGDTTVLSNWQEIYHFFFTSGNEQSAA